ncbi:MAG: MBL fold metallo-hydrolase [Prolixibacteraceae bacterium]|nr:MBL fold metallo-hydrolase [Prolixibacteraceae bacterium]
MRIRLLLLVLIALSSVQGIARETVIRKLTSNVVVVTPGKKQLHTLGWPNDIINSVAVKTGKGLVLIDTQNSPANARLIKNAVQDNFNDSTFVYIINTHGHSCHSGGNCIFTESQIVAQQNSEAEIKDYDDLFLGQTVEFLRKKIYHKSNVLDTISTSGVLSDSINQAIELYRFYENDLINNYHARYADLTFDETMTLNAGEKTIHLYYMGKGHGDADIAVYIRDEKVLCTGNLFHLGAYEHETMPSFYQFRVNEIDHWISTLEEILKPENAIDHVISTHGKHSFKKENLEFILDYCKAVRKEVKRAKSQQIPIESVQEITIFEDLFNQYQGIVPLNKEAREMHARNVAIIWRNIK